MQYVVKLSMLHTSPFSTSFLHQNLAATGEEKMMKRGEIVLAMPAMPELTLPAAATGGLTAALRMHQHQCQCTSINSHHARSKLPVD